MRKGLILGSALIIFAGTFPALAANTMTVTTPGLNGTGHKLQLNDEDDCGVADTPVFVQSDEPTNESHIKIKFRLSAANLTAPASGGGRAFRFMNLQDNDDLANPAAILFAQRQSSTGNWRLIGWIRNTVGNNWQYVGSLFLFTYQNSGEPQIECDWYAATGAGNTNSDARFTCTKVGTVQVFDSGTTLSTNNRTIDHVQVGYFDYDGFGGGACNGGGYLSFDEYESYR